MDIDLCLIEREFLARFIYKLQIYARLYKIHAPKTQHPCPKLYKWYIVPFTEIMFHKATRSFTLFTAS